MHANRKREKKRARRERESLVLSLACLSAVSILAMYTLSLRIMHVCVCFRSAAISLIEWREDVNESFKLESLYNKKCIFIRNFDY